MSDRHILTKENDLHQIHARDAESAETWFKEPAVGACGRAFIDRRWLLIEIERLQKDLRRANAALVRHGVEEMRPGNAAEPNERLTDCEASLRIYDPGLTSEYWLRHAEKSSRDPNECICTVAGVYDGCPVHDSALKSGVAHEGYCLYGENDKVGKPFPCLCGAVMPQESAPPTSCPHCGVQQEFDGAWHKPGCPSL